MPELRTLGDAVALLDQWITHANELEREIELLRIRLETAQGIANAYAEIITHFEPRNVRDEVPF